MARRGAGRKTQPKGSQAIVIFWLVFIIAIIAIFMINAETISRNFNVFRDRMAAPQGTEDEILFFEEEEPQVTVVIEPTRPVTTTEPRPQEPDRTEVSPPVQVTPPTPEPQPPAPVQVRERVIYFTHVGADGQILQSRVTRRLPVSGTPMQDALNEMLLGPSAEEISRGILNLIPQNTRILAATVRGSTAYISFSEDFLFNTFGVEGYVAQLRQIVWTVTEFPNVNDVQLLIEGRRMDFLGEGIWIGSPISRQSF